jgi:hypothetical protein
MPYHPTLQTGLRAWVERQTHHPLGYVEQLYTFADRTRAAAGSGWRIVSLDAGSGARQHRGRTLRPCALIRRALSPR